ncbi:unnamed protein product [Adineta steineri]|uniref:Uncharacterized protein n=1 Tax=Adineta steineri TaxID=433720 RepID=A0A814P347_9BILA|nr:unnamed protein product [Adineta steineri]CAF3837645.1 unnamed protein product [Adineta steineri]
MDIKIMTNIRIIQICYWWLLILTQSIYSISPQAQFISLCGQTYNLSSSSLSIIYTRSSYISCCNITVTKSALSDSSQRIIINILNMSMINSPLKISNKENDMIKFDNYVSSNRTYFKSDIVNLPITFSLCQYNIQPFEILITNITQGPCKPNQYDCSTTTDEQQWCIDEIYHCDGYHSCPQGTDEDKCSKSITKSTSSKNERTIRGGVVTSIIIFGLLLIIASVGIGLTFIYVRRKRQRNRQFTYSLESTSDDWEPTSTGYRLFDNWTNNRRHTENNNNDNVLLDANEHMPIATNMTNR